MCLDHTPNVNRRDGPATGPSGRHKSPPDRQEAPRLACDDVLSRAAPSWSTPPPSHRHLGPHSSLVPPSLQALRQGSRRRMTTTTPIGTRPRVCGCCRSLTTHQAPVVDPAMRLRSPGVPRWAVQQFYRWLPSGSPSSTSDGRCRILLPMPI